MSAATPRILLGELATLVTKGTTPKTLGYLYTKTGIPFLRAENISDLSVKWSDDALYIDEVTDKALSRSRIFPNDVLISIAGTIGRVGVVPEEAPPLNCNQAVAIVRPGPRVSPRYLAYWLSCGDAQRQIAKAQVTATISNLSLGQISKLEVPLPPLPEQRRIADILDKADAIRRKRKQAIALTAQLLRSTFMSTVGPLAPAYDHWPIKPLRDLAADTPHSMRTGPFGSDLKHSEFVESGVCVLGIDNAVQNRFAWGERRFISLDKYKHLIRYTVNPGDVIVTIMGTVGRSAVIPNDIPLSITSKHLATITLNREIADPCFISQALVTHPEVLSQISESNRGAIMNGLNLGLIKQLQIRLPPLETQLEFSSLTRRIRQLEARLRAGVIESENLFSGLSFAAFGGRLSRTEQVTGQLSMFNK